MKSPKFRLVQETNSYGTITFHIEKRILFWWIKFSQPTINKSAAENRFQELTKKKVITSRKIIYTDLDSILS